MGVFALIYSDSASGTTIQAEHMNLSSSHGKVIVDAKARGGKALLIWSNATATKTVNVPKSDKIVIRVKGDQCNGSPQMTVKIDGKQVIQAWVWQSQYVDYIANVDLSSGYHKIEVQMGHDYRTSYCDRNLRVDSVFFQAVEEVIPPPEATPPTETIPPSTSNPFVNEKLYVNPYSPAANQVREWSVSRPEDAKHIEKIASQPIAVWFGDWTRDIRVAVNDYVTTAKNSGSLPVMVAYNIPIRDCGSYSAGGAPTAQAYRDWIDAFSAGINGRKSVVILEPDAVPHQGCLTQVQIDERNALLKYAVDTLSASGASVYLDAGHSNWHSAEETARRLNAAGVQGARGFSLNVSNFEYTQNSVRFGDAVSSSIGKPYIVDTGRNGLGPGNDWCNPSGRALGEKPTANTGTKADAYLWVKPPGESDGTCNGGPSAGQWWADYALGLAQRAY